LGPVPDRLLSVGLLFVFNGLLSPRTSTRTQGPARHVYGGEKRVLSRKRASPGTALIPGPGPASITLGFALGLRALGPRACFAFGAGLHKAISYAQFSDENLLGQLANEDAKIMRVVNVDRPPDLLEQVLVGDDVARMLREHLEQAIFLRRQR